MRIPNQVLAYYIMILQAGFCLFACATEEPETSPAPEIPIDAEVVAALDRVSDKLRFSGSTKLQGNAPAAPAASSLKFSIKDTLYLMPGIKTPVKFLHAGGTQNVAGAYVQVYNASAGAHYYFDVPVHREVGSDSISLVLIGFENDSTGLAPFSGSVLPGSWVGAEDDVDIEITPYDESGQPIDEVTVPIVVEKSSNNREAANAPDLCGLINEEGSWWEWDTGWIIDELPEVEIDIYGPESILTFRSSVKGCCDNGISEYSDFCLGTPLERTLSFNFFTHYAYESIHFHNNGHYARVTETRRNNPDIEHSDFCNESGKGLVTPTRVANVTHRGDWKITSGVVPSNSRSKVYPPGTPVEFLTTFAKSQSPRDFTGFPSVEGIIRQVGCSWLILVKLDNEGGTQTIFNAYTRRRPNEEYWHSL